MMKGTLLVLALLVTRELGIQMAESCPIFYGVFGTLAIGSKSLLDASLDLVHATQPEKVALEKIQDCYNEAGIESKILDLIVMLIQNSPDSSTSPSPSSPSATPPTSVENGTGKEEKAQVKKQKNRTVFSQTQLCVLNERFQRQKYLSLQQMQELSSILNLSYKQIKTWFQNQRMKCKRRQKYNWPKNSHCVTQMSSATTDYLGLSSSHQGCLVNASGNLSMWSNHSWTSPSWNYPAWNGQTWCPQAWNNQAWNNQAWNNQFLSYGEEALQPQIQFQQNPVSDLEASLEIAGETYDAILQAPKYYGTQQSMDLFPDYSMSI